MARRARTAAYLERGPKRTFACAVEWPGWSRVARGDVPALDALAEYAPRYARVAAHAGLAFDPDARIEVAESVAGDATTDFGAPSAVAEVDRRPLDAQEARRLAALLSAAWDELDAVALAAPPSLRKGPRGGGRDRDAMVAHVVDAERSYARKIGVALTAAEWRDGNVGLMRERILDVVRRASDGVPVVERRWPVRYLVRRTAWHALDHAWEMEDRSA